MDVILKSEHLRASKEDCKNGGGSSFETPRESAAPPAITAKPLRGDDGVTNSGCSRRGAAGCVVKPRQQRLRRIVGLQGRERHGRLRLRVALAMVGMPHHAGKPPRNHLAGA